MFYKNIFMVGLGVILLTVASCSGPKAEPSKKAAIVKNKRMGEVPEKPKEVSKKEKIKMAYVRLNEDEAYKDLREMASKVYADGALSRKTKELIAVGISITNDCETCADSRKKSL